MKYCKNCGKEMNEQSRFCSACGTRSAQTTEHSQATYCEYCGKELHEGAAFCAYCGKQCAHAPETEYGTPETAVSCPQESSGRYSILEYLRELASLEKSLYTQNQTIEQLRTYVDSLGKKGNFAKPSKQYSYEDIVQVIVIPFSVLFVGAVSGCLIGVSEGNPFAWAAGFGGVSFALVLALLISSKKDAYEKRMEAYHANVEADEKRVADELKRKSQLQKLLDDMVEKMEETKSIRDRYYAENVLHEGYRNMEAVCALYHYFDTGICSILVGNGGAYGRYDLEKRHSETNDILKGVRYDLRTFYCAVKRDVQQLVLEIAKQTQFTAQIAENTAVAAYYSEIAAGNARACALIGLANHIGIWEVHRRIGE